MKATSIRYDDRAAVWIGLLIGVVSFMAYFGIDRALGLGAAYRWPAGDQAQHIAGAFAYLDADWTFPIFNTDRINYPSGVNIIFTDSAPFAGLVAKLFYSLSGIRFNYLGTWFAVLWVGQAAAGAFLMRQLAPQRPLLHICGAIIALAWPAFLNRHFHLALSSHFLLVFALGLYFETTRESYSRKRLVFWCLLLGVSLWTHVYIFLMSFAVFTAATADAVLREKSTAKEAALCNIAALLWCLSLAFIGGYQTAGGINAFGYRSFRMDLLAYFWPHGSAFIYAPPISDPAVTFEGFNYLGLGGIAIVAGVLVLVRQRHCCRLTMRPWLVACIVGMTAFAVTNYVSFAGIPILEFPLPIENFPFSTFRASGRFGWPLGYLAVFGGLAFIDNRLAPKHRRTAIAIICGLTCLQVADTRNLFVGVKEGWIASARPAAEDAIRSSTDVYFDPPIDCMKREDAKKEATELLALAAREGKRTNSAHIARANAAKCSSELIVPSPGRLIISPADTPNAAFYASRMICQTQTQNVLCR